MPPNGLSFYHNNFLGLDLRLRHVLYNADIFAATTGRAVYQRHVIAIVMCFERQCLLALLAVAFVSILVVFQ